MSLPLPSPAALPAVDVACLCAAWCRVCEAYAPVFDAVLQPLRQLHPGLQTHWIDIEDEAELLGDYEVDSFPTLVVADIRGPRFAGALTPQPEILGRVLQAALDGPAAFGGEPAAALLGFTRRLALRTPAPSR